MDGFVDTVVIGAGQAGLATSRCLTDRGIAHVVLERGDVGHRWRTQRWDSFTLLSPNWLTRLPGFAYGGRDPHGFQTGTEVADLLAEYARTSAAPVRTGVGVQAVGRGLGGLVVRTDAGVACVDNVVVATGDLDRPAIPALDAALPDGVTRLHTSGYRNPAQLPPGGVLVVGAGPSGQQIADELARAGRTVHLAAGRHRTLPRRYRGHDTYWWMHRTGALYRTRASLSGDPRRDPNPVLAGGVDDLDLHRLVRHGVVPHGRLTGVAGGVATFATDLPETLHAADAHAARFRASVDAFVARTGLAVPPAPAWRPPAAPWAEHAATVLDLDRAGITTVVWATGFRRDFSWLPDAVLDAAGEPVHDRGVTALPGLYVIGLRWLHRRSSHALAGVGADAEHLADHIAARVAASFAPPVLVPA
jgi:putative flavoprotein involved in K+ transport